MADVAGRASPRGCLCRPWPLRTSIVAGTFCEQPPSSASPTHMHHRCCTRSETRFARQIPSGLRSGEPAHPAASGCNALDCRDYWVASASQEVPHFAGTRAQTRAFRGAIIARISARRDRAIRADLGRLAKSRVAVDMRWLRLSAGVSLLLIGPRPRVE